MQLLIFGIVQITYSNIVSKEGIYTINYIFKKKKNVIS